MVGVVGGRTTFSRTQGLVISVAAHARTPTTDAMKQCDMLTGGSFAGGAQLGQAAAGMSFMPLRTPSQQLS